MIKDRAPLVANPPDLNGVLSGMSFPEIEPSDNILQAQADMPLVSNMINMTSILFYTLAHQFTFHIQHPPGELQPELKPNLVLLDVAKDVGKGEAKGKAKGN